MSQHNNVISFDNYFHARGRTRPRISVDVATAYIEAKAFLALAHTQKLSCSQLTYVAAKLLSPLAVNIMRRMLIEVFNDTNGSHK